MESNFRGNNSLVMSFKKTDGKWQIKSTATESTENVQSLRSNSFSEDDDDSLLDTTYIPPTDVNLTDDEYSPFSNSGNDINNAKSTVIATSPVKRKRNVNNWKRTLNKTVRNSGKEYVMVSNNKRIRKERQIEPPCTERCRLKCFISESFISAVRAARKTGKPFNVTEMTFEDFYDIKALFTEMGLQNMTQVKISTVVTLRFDHDEPNTIFYKTSYNDNKFEVVKNVIKSKHNKDITLTRAYYTKPKIADKKKKDLLELIEKNYIPKYYKAFYEQL